MAGWKDTGIANPGTGIKYGADDVEMLMRMLNGVTTGINSVEIKSTNKWGFWDNILYVRNQADSRNTTIRGQSNVPATDVTLALPPTTANDTLAAIGLRNLFSVGQEFQAGAIFKQQSTPANPAATYHHFYTASNGHLIRRNSSGVEIDYDSFISGLPTGLDKYIQYNNSGVFGSEAGFEYDHAANEATIPGLTVTQNLILNGVISPPQITASQNNYNPTGLATATTLRLTSDTARDIHGLVAQPSGTVLVIHNVGSFNIVLKDESGSATSTNRFAFPSDVTLGTDNSVSIKYDGTTGRWRLISAGVTTAGFALLNDDNVFTTLQKIQIDGIPWGLDFNRTDNSVGNDIEINFNFHNSINVMSNYAKIVGQIVDATSGSQDGKLEFHVTQNNVDREVVNIWGDGGFDCGGINRRIKLIDTGLTAQNTYTFPDITTKLAGVAAENVFTDLQKIQTDGQSDTLDLVRTDNVIGDAVNLDFVLHDSTNAEVNYARITGEIVDPVAGSEDGLLSIYTRRADGLNRTFTLNEWGKLTIGPDSSNAGAVTRNVVRSGVTQDFHTTSAETTIFTQSVLANTIGSSGILHLKILGAIQNNQATATTFTLRIKFGGTTYWADDIAASLGQSATALPFILDVWIVNVNATNSQRLYGTFMMNDTAAPTTGSGDAGDDEGASNGVIAASALNKDTTVNQTLAVTMQMSVSNAAVHTYIDYTWLEINPV